MEEKKRCTQCGDLKFLNLFYRDSRQKSGFRPNCKACHSSLASKWWSQHGKEHYQKHKENQREWRIKNPERYAARQRRYHLRRKYGFDQAGFQKRLVEQGGKCACCGSSGIELVVDHCHTTANVRDLICQPCNKGLGAFSDSIERLQKAIAYLKKHAEE